MSHNILTISELNQLVDNKLEIHMGQIWGSGSVYSSGSGSRSRFDTQPTILVGSCINFKKGKEPDPNFSQTQKDMLHTHIIWNLRLWIIGQPFATLQQMDLIMATNEVYGSLNIHIITKENAKIYCYMLWMSNLLRKKKGYSNNFNGLLHQMKLQK